MADLDQRLNAYRDDLADVALEGKVKAREFIAGRPARVRHHFADMLTHPENGAGLLTQTLFGHEVRVFEERDGWAWIKRKSDGYVGYVRSDALAELGSEPTHMVFAPRTFLYSQSDLKSPRTGYRSMGSLLTVVDQVETRGTFYAILNSGEAVISKHLRQLGDWEDDPVTVAERLIHTPYLWGGDSGFGIDCSGLVFLANMLCGREVLRDSDMQAESVGTPIDPGNDYQNLQRGDLVFWKGHVGLMRDAENLLHANGHSMDVTVEPLREAIDRTGYLYNQPTGFRRP